MLERWTRWVARSRTAVLVGWSVLVVLGVLASSRLPGLLTTSLAVPSTGSAQANSILVAHFDDNVEGTYTVVFLAPHASPGEVRALERRTAAAARVVPTAAVSQFHAAPGVVVGVLTSSLDLAEAASHVDALRAALREGLPASYVTGPPALQHDLTPILTSDLHHGELYALLCALVLLALLLGVCGALAIPFVVAAATVATSLAALYELAHVMLMVLYVPNLVALIGFGLAVDYSLLLVCRFREELDDPDVEVDDALVRTMATAGRAAVRSGVAVAAGLAAMLLVPVPFVRSLGVAGLVVPLVSIAAVLTLQPALLALLGRGWLRAPGPRWARATRTAGSRRRVAGLVRRRPVAVLCSTAAVLAVAAAPLGWLQLTPGSTTAIPASVPAARGLALLSTAVGPGAATPIDVVLDAGAPGAMRSRGVQAALGRFLDSTSEDPEVSAVVFGTRPPYVDATGRYSQVLVVGRHSLGDEATQALVARVRDRYVPAARFPRSVLVAVGGAPAQGVDFLDRLYSAFPLVVALALALAYALLLRAFRSVLLPLLAVVLDLVTVAATYGVLVVVFRFGLGARALGLYHVDQLEGWVPVFLFAMLFGLSMDYEVFFVSRMRESFDVGHDTDEAVAEGLSHTGRLVTVAALVMVGALLGLVLGHIAGLQELGVGLAVGVVLDATVVRGLVLPSVLTVLGPRSWWLPAPLARLARVAPSPLSVRGEGATSAHGPSG